MSTAKDLFNQYIEGGLTKINSLMGTEVETEYLDFKLASRGMDKDAKKNLSVALSGFANSDGGVIVWGIDCRRIESGADVVSELAPIPGLKKFKTELYALTAHLAGRPQWPRWHVIQGVATSKERRD